MSIEIVRIKKLFGCIQVLNDILLDIFFGQMVVLLGLLGFGKMMLLCIIVGLEYQFSGYICFYGMDVSCLYVCECKVGFVFQYYVLFCYMMVFDNIVFGLMVLL